MVIKVAFSGHVQMGATHKRCNLHWSIFEQLGCVFEFIVMEDCTIASFLPKVGAVRSLGPVDLNDRQMTLGNKWEKEICRSRILALRFPVHTLRRFR